MTFPINQRISLSVSNIPVSARRIALTVTPAAGGSATIEGGSVITAGESQASLTPNALGTWGYAWSARDPSGLEVGTATGTFEVVEAAPATPVAMNATVTS